MTEKLSTSDKLISDAMSDKAILDSTLVKLSCVFLGLILGMIKEISELSSYGCYIEKIIFTAISLLVLSIIINVVSQSLSITKINNYVVSGKSQLTPSCDFSLVRCCNAVHEVCFILSLVCIIVIVGIILKPF